MLAHIVRCLRLPSTTHPLARYSFSALKKFTEADQLSNSQLEELLGKEIKEVKPVVNQQAKQVLEVDQKAVIENDKTFYYGLMPLKNENYPECLDPEEYVIEETPNQNIFASLQLPDSCSFADYISALSKFRTETSLYGDEQPKQTIQKDSLQFKDLLDPQGQYISRARKYHMINISMPGSIQCQDPRNFMQLRPIQQFRHTPLIPISQSYMQRHKEMLERYHRKQFVFEISKQKIINWVLVSFCVSVGGYMLYMILKKEEERTVSFTRMKYHRLMGESTEKPIFKF